jgi:hypothetical protein
MTIKEGKPLGEWISAQSEGQEQEVEGTKQHPKDTTSHGGGGVLRTGEVLYLGCICGSSTSGLLQTAQLSGGLLLHHRNKLLKGEQGLVQAFDRYAFDGLRLMPDNQLLLHRVHTEIHVVAYQGLLNIISDVIQDHGAIMTNGCRMKCWPCTWRSQASGSTRPGTGGKAGREGKATRGGRLPQVSA